MFESILSILSLRPSILGGLFRIEINNKINNIIIQSGASAGNPLSEPPVVLRITNLREAGDACKKRCMVCKNGEVIFIKDERLPDKINSGEVLWIMPLDGTELTVTINGGEKSLELKCKIVFPEEYSATFARFLVKWKTPLYKNDIVALITGEWENVKKYAALPSVGQIFTNDEIKQCRTFLSMLLTENYGIRCSDFVAEWKESVPETEPPRNSVSQEERRQIKKLVVQILGWTWTENGWQRMMNGLGEAGYKPSRTEAVALDILRNDYFSRQKSKAETAKEIADLLLAARNRTVQTQNEIDAFWKIAEMREGIVSDAVPPNLVLSKTKPPKYPFLWFTFNQARIDDKLCAYIRQNIESMNRQYTLLEVQLDFRQRAALLPMKAVLDRLTQRADHLPTLSGKHKTFQKRQRPMGELLEALQRTVPALQIAYRQLADAVVNLPKETPEKAEVTVKQLTVSLTVLETELQTREHIYISF